MKSLQRIADGPARKGIWYSAEGFIIPSKYSLRGFLNPDPVSDVLPAFPRELGGGPPVGLQEFWYDITLVSFQNTYMIWALVFVGEGFDWKEAFQAFFATVLRGPNPDPVNDNG